MKERAFRIPLLIAALSIAATISLQAAPSLSITKPPVIPNSLTGPMTDPMAINGQWFSVAGVEEYRTHEFHDNLMELGGGQEDSYAIYGMVVSMEYAAGGSGGYGDPIIGFKIEATIANDTHTATGDYTDASNSHGESRQAGTEFYAGTLVDTKLTAEFAIADINLLPNTFDPPYRQLLPYIIADNEEQLAWYCWNPENPPADSEAGKYYVPTWDFGDILLGQSASRVLSFSVDPPMDPTDPRYDALYGSLWDGVDIFANRTTSLKISTWIDNLGEDTGDAFPEEVLRSSDVSVFHNEEEPYEPTHKMHYPQLPDPHGWDVRACNGNYNPDDGLQKVLADDFRCTSNGPITKITFWGSFKDDEYEDEEGSAFHGITNIHLSLHHDIPAGELAEYSMPMLPAEWERDFNPESPPAGWGVEMIPEISSLQGWYDPNTGEVMPENHMDYFRYEITIPASEAFVQTAGTIYWLDISVETYWQTWGWKTSRSEHFNDDAVWADMPVTNQMQWKELVDPHTGESLDLAFIIDGGEEPPPDEFDWGDAPDQPYPTLAVNNGASHFITAGMFLGAAIDAEPDGQPEPAALGDDMNINGLGGVPYPPGDEDGVVFTSLLVPGVQATLTITASMPGMMDAWIDYNSDGAWAVGEQLKGGTFALAAGVNTINIAVPASALPTASTFARFRFSSAGGLLPFGSAPDGEVEDYEVFIEEELQDELDWGDAPDRPYPTLNASGGANHFIVAGAPYFDDGSQTDQPDPEPDGQPDPNAMGDDNDGNDDEDGIIIPVLTAGQPGSVTITVAGGAAGGYVDAWIDFNGNGVWEASERIYSGWMLQGPNPVSFIVPLGFSGQTFARFRINSQAAGLPPTGGAQDGEVEDHEVFIEEEQEELDWGDAPDFAGGASFNTLAANSGANHTIMPGIYMGASIDAELDGQPTVAADGDDLNGVPDDEDGVAFPPLFIPGQNAQFIVTIAPTAPGGTLDVWLDVDQNGNWLGPNDYVWSGPVNPGPNPVNIPFPYTMVPGQSYMRFRYNTGGPLPVTGWARDGEVEDYAIHIEKPEFDWGDAPDRPYPTLSGSIGANHIIATGVLLGSSIDPELDGQPDPQALGDDNDGNDDEDGVTFVDKIVAGSNATINVVAGPVGGNLDAWIDFDANGAWNHPGEHLWNGISQPLLSGPNSLAFTVPGLPAQALGPTFARFRISSAGGLPPDNTGILTPDGEVEDYMVELFQPAPTNLVITNLTFLVSNTVAKVEWTVESGITYQMQARTNLMTNAWVDVETTVLGPVNWQTNNMAAESNKFYRVTAPWTE